MSGISYLQGGPTWNVATGCSPVHTGCKNCWAKSLHDMRHRAWLAYDTAIQQGGKISQKMPPQYAESFDVVQLKPDRLADPLHWRKPRTIGVNFGGDLFHKDVPDGFIDRVFAVMALCAQHRFILPTKRIARAADYTVAMCNGKRWLGDALKHVGMEGFAGRLGIAAALGAMGTDGKPPYTPFPNLMLVYSASDQATLDAGMPHLLRANVARRGLSLEPLVGDVDLDGYTCDKCGAIEKGGLGGWNDGKCGRCGESVLPELNRNKMFGKISWVTVGCESGPNRRPMELAWARSIVNQCKAAGVRTWVKQLSIGGKVCTDWNRFPLDLRVQQAPFGEVRP